MTSSGRVAQRGFAINDFSFIADFPNQQNSTMSKLKILATGSPKHLSCYFKIFMDFGMQCVNLIPYLAG